MTVALKAAADWCVKHSIIIPDDIVAGLYQHGVDVKTPGYYARVMWEAVRELYAGDIEAYDFEEVMLRLISEQLRKAWNEGMRQLELDPETDQTEEGEAYLQEIMASELDYVGQLAEDIIAAADNKIDVKGGEGSGNFGHEGRPGEVGGSGPGGGGYAKEKRDSLVLSGSERTEIADSGHFLHGTGKDFDKFELQPGEHLSQIYLSDPSYRTSNPTQAEAYAENNGRLLEVAVDWENANEFSPPNDPIAKELRAEYFKDRYDPSPSYLIPYPEMQPFVDFVENKYPGKYNVFRVDEFHSESYAFTDPNILKIIKEFTK